MICQIVIIADESSLKEIIINAIATQSADNTLDRDHAQARKIYEKCLAVVVITQQKVA